LEITIKIDNRKQEAKALLAYLNELPFVKVENKKPRCNIETKKAIQDVKNGIGVTKVENVADLFEKLDA
jgi:antitoxin component of RelBE/YafQ-DinJ toxin-antitoxin module